MLSVLSLLSGPASRALTELPLLVRLVDDSPQPEDVKAGWTAFVIFLLLAVAVVGLGLSLTKQLRKAKAAQEAGVYGDEPATGRSDDGAEPPSAAERP